MLMRLARIHHDSIERGFLRVGLLKERAEIGLERAVGDVGVGGYGVCGCECRERVCGVRCLAFAVPWVFDAWVRAGEEVDGSFGVFARGRAGAARELRFIDFLAELGVQSATMMPAKATLAVMTAVLAASSAADTEAVAIDGVGFGGGRGFGFEVANF